MNLEIRNDEAMQSKAYLFIHSFDLGASKWKNKQWNPLQTPVTVHQWWVLYKVYKGLLGIFYFKKYTSFKKYNCPLYDVQYWCFVIIFSVF